MPRIFWGALLWAMLTLFALPVLAQSTGGSFGGGNFGRPSNEGSGSGGTYGGGNQSPNWGGSNNPQWGSSNNNNSPSSWGGNSGPGSYSGGSGGTGGLIGGACCFLLILGIVAVALVMRGKKGGGAPMAAGSGPSGPAIYHGKDAMHVSQLSLGIDWRARGELQQALARLAQSGDTRSPQGLANLLRETVLALRRAELSWLYVAYKNVGPFSPQNAEQQFHQLTNNARAAFRHELVRAAGGQVQTTDAPQMQAQSTEGEGTVVVHLILATYRPVAALQNPDANQIRMALDNRAALTADQLGVLEVVWSPAAENDRMSTGELEQFYPDLRLIDPNSIAGRIFCTFCRGPFAMELLKCPHCGAPAEASQNNRAPR